MPPSNPKLPFVLSSLLLFFFLLSPSLSQNLPSDDHEKTTLLQLKRHWSDPPALASWTPSIPHCNWTGIQCNPQSGLVSQLSLPGASIAGDLPSFLCAALANLSVLDLSNNNLSGPFPTSLYNCSRLNYLDLSQNLFVGDLPSDIHRMSSVLADLYLSANNFSGQIPASIGGIASLRALYLDNNLFNGTIPANFSSNLEELALAYNPFGPQTIPEAFSNLTALDFLWMTQTNLVGEVPGSWGRLTELRQLDLGQNSLNGSIPNSLWALESLQLLYLYDNNLGGEITGPVTALGLQGIDLSMNQLTGSIPADFGELKNLSVLLLYFNQLSGEIPAGIGLLPSLSDLRLFNNKLTGPLPTDLGKHCPLQNLEVDDNMLSGELPEGLCANGALTSVVVFDNNLTGTIPQSLGECAGLDNLQLYSNRFHGDLPAGIWSAVNLSTVILRDNNLSGVLPDKLPWNLTRLDIQNNRFSGKIPTVAGNLLIFLARNNLFSGEIPASFFSGIPKLQSLSLGGNTISGSIPNQISTLTSLNDLNLSSNQLTGEIPASIGSFPGLTSLDLSNNHLSGSIPPDISSLMLNFLNLSANQLTGEVPFSLQIQAYDQSFTSNPGLCSRSSALNLSSCGGRQSTESSSKPISAGLMIMIVVIGVLLFSVMSVFGFFVIRDCKTKRNYVEQSLAPWKLTSFHSLDFNESSIVGSLTPENLIGSGGSGLVYRVTVSRRADEAVAVKRIHIRGEIDAKLEKEFVSEVQILGSIRHTNIVKLLCCISSADSKLLVYEYMKNGSLDVWLHVRRRVGGGPVTTILDWPRRLGVAIGAAQGLCYMHHDCSPPIVHRDVKSSNILLDSEFRARIADFGLARMLVTAGEPSSVTAVAGSFGYMAPECAYAAKVNEKMDVYSFGVVLLELTTGREANDGGEQGGLADWAWHHFQAGNRAIDAIDEAIRDADEYLDEVAKVMKLGLLCTGTLPSTRPTMKDVVGILLRCDRTAWNEGKAPQSEHDVAPLLRTTRGSRHASDFCTGDDEDDDCSGLARNV